MTDGEEEKKTAPGDPGEPEEKPGPPGDSAPPPGEPEEKGGPREAGGAPDGRAPDLDDRPSMSYWAIVYSQFLKNRVAVNCFRILVVLFLVATFAPLLASRYPFFFSDGLRQTLRIGDEVEVGPMKFAVEFGRAPASGDADEVGAAGGSKASADRKESFLLVRKDAPGWAVVREGILAGSEEKCTFRSNGEGLAGKHASFGLFRAMPYVKDESGERSLKVNGRLLGEWSLPFLLALFNANEYELSVDRFFNLLIFALPALALAYLSLRRFAGLGLTATRWLTVALSTAVLCAGGLWVNFKPLEAPYRDYLSDLAAEKADLTSLNPLVSGKHSFGLFPLIRRGYRDPNSTIQFRGPLRTVKKSQFYSPYVKNTDDLPDPEAQQTMLSLGFLCGTDEIGRDVFARLLYGTRISLTIGVFAVALYIAIGVFVGGVAGFFGGWVDILFQRVIEIMMCFPTFFLILTIVAILESKSIFIIMLVIGITSWTGVARLVRGEFLKQKTIDYVIAARALGVGRMKIMFKHILPNAVAPVLVSATFGIASAILTETGLSYLGLGDVRAPSWGQILVAGRESRELYLILISGFAIFFTVTILNLVGEGARDALDPKLRK